MQHELAAWGLAVGGDKGGFDAKLVRRARLALADTFDLGRVEGIELVAALALLLGTDLRGLRKRLLEGRLELALAFDLAADVADEATKPRSQQAQLPSMALELLGVGIAGSHHRRPPWRHADRTAAAAHRARGPGD